MDEQTRDMLEVIVAQGTETYATTASGILSGKLAWPKEQIIEFIDGYLNDPYLTRNE